MRQDDFKRAMKLPESARQEILDGMDRSASAERDPNAARRRDQRKDARWSYRETDIAVTIEHPAGGVSRLLLFTRNLSAGGISFLHNGFLHPKSRCKAVLPRRDGRHQLVTGSIVSCRHVSGLLHEIGLKFDRRIDPSQFVRTVRSAPVQPPPGSLSPSSCRVLVIDDNEAERALLLHHLKSSGIEPLSAAGASAADVLAREKADVILAELNLQGIDGVEAIRKWRAAGYKGAILVLTAEVDEARIAAACEAGATRVVAKPYTPAQILEFLSGIQHAAAAQNDHEVLHSTVQDQSGMENLIARYIDQVHDISQRIDKALVENSFAEVRQLCLSLKGSAPGYGFAPLGDAAMEALKTLDASQSLTTAADQVRELSALCGRLQPRTGGPDAASKPSDA